MNNIERTLLPEFNKTIYILQGRALSHTWLVRAFRDKITAENYARACRRKSLEWHESFQPPFEWSKLDPKMLITPGNGAHYQVLEVPISLRPEEISSANDTCPICRQQVYSTSQGKVCENGHEVY